ncbi:MAG TPA: hypothetical protein PKU69_05490, partial [Bacillota bacterium]|nr:hypothetical protein [Bacillota bacterium]
MENTIYLSDMGFGGSFNVSPNIDYQTDLGVVDNSYTEGVLEKMIDLDDYHLQIVEEDGVYFMPLYLANLFLTGDYLNVYETDNKLYIIDDFADAYDFLDNSVIDSALDSENILENTINFTSLFFDYFYGLKGFFGVDSYIDE